jgi:hypothetical protein
MTAGLLLVVTGLILIGIEKLPFDLGNLPGDLVIKKVTLAFIFLL